ncbi:MAG: YggS family pyridoxal phosphate-dependent enzyme [Chlamydiota bacterium]
MRYLTPYMKVLEDVAAVARSCGRKPEEITVVAVSKYIPLPDIQTVYSEGCRDFGESRLTEALEKAAHLPQGVRWHLIGSLQSKKVNKAIGKFDLIHSVDTLKLAHKISSSSLSHNITTNILLQVNTSGEESKHGFAVEECISAFEEVQNLPNIKVEGLMTMAPATEDTSIIRRCFKQLAELRDQLGVKHLSMGMSNDYRIAIEEGSTMVRVGSRIFSG